MKYGKDIADMCAKSAKQQGLLKIIKTKREVRRKKKKSDGGGEGNIAPHIPVFMMTKILGDG